MDGMKNMDGSSDDDSAITESDNSYTESEEETFLANNGGELDSIPLDYQSGLDQASGDEFSLTKSTVNRAILSLHLARPLSHEALISV